MDDNGAIVYDSHAICTYLVEKYARDDKLYPKNLLDRAQVDARLHFDSGVLFARMRFLFEPILYFGCKQLPADKIESIEKCWSILEAVLEQSDYLSGNTLTIGDICCIASIYSMDTVIPIEAGLYPKLTAWRKRMEQLPRYEELCGTGGQEVQNIVATKLKET